MLADVDARPAGALRRVARRPSTGWARSTVCAGSGAGPCSASPRATWRGARSRRSSPRSAPSPTPASPRRSPAPGGDTLAVIGLGKLGGDELNYASDVDLLFLHRRRGPDAQQRAERAAAALDPRCSSDPTAEGIALRVDADLRPGGRAGALSRSLDATARVLRARAATWERQAHDQGPPGRGRPATSGAAFCEGIDAVRLPRRAGTRRRSRTFGERRSAWRSTSGSGARSSPRSSAAGAASATWSSRCSSCRSCTGGATRRSASPTRSPRSARSRRGLRRRGRRRALADAYRFLRRLEHRLQIVRDLQTHDLPADRRRAHHAGALAGPGRRRRAPGRVRTRRPSWSAAIHERLFYRPLLEAFAGPVQPLARARPRGDRGAAGRARVRASRRAPTTCCTGWSTRHADRQGPRARVPGDGAGAGARRRPRRGARPAGTDRRGGRGRGPRAADALAADPHRGSPARARRRRRARSRPTCWWPSPTRIRALSDSLLGGASRRRGRAGRCRRARPRRASSRPRETGEALAAVADARGPTRRSPRPSPTLPLAVIGMGKLGAQELNVASDLDLLFVYEGEGSRRPTRERAPPPSA